MLGNVRLAFGPILENVQKSSESGWKTSEGSRKSMGNRPTRRHQHVYIMKETLHVSSKI